MKKITSFASFWCLKLAAAHLKCSYVANYLPTRSLSAFWIHHVDQAIIPAFRAGYQLFCCQRDELTNRINEQIKGLVPLYKMVDEESKFMVNLCSLCEVFKGLLTVILTRKESKLLLLLPIGSQRWEINPFIWWK